MGERCGFEFLMNSGIAQRINTLSEYILKDLGDLCESPLKNSLIRQADFLLTT